MCRAAGFWSCEKKSAGVCVCFVSPSICFKGNGCAHCPTTVYDSVCFAQSAVYLNMTRACMCAMAGPRGSSAGRVRSGGKVAAPQPRRVICEAVPIRRVLPQHKWKCFSNLYIFRGRNQSACVC